MLVSYKGQPYELDFPDSLKECVKRYSEDTVYYMLVKAMNLYAKDFIRNSLKDGKSVKEVQELLHDYRPRPYKRSWLRNEFLASTKLEKEIEGDDNEQSL